MTISLGTKVDHTYLAKTDLWKKAQAFAYLEYLEQDKGSHLVCDLAVSFCHVPGKASHTDYSYMKLKF